ncbi:hypothetical protein HDF18_20510 [Mucilaginibacter sp. X5P1]|uniref:hypothetical protein n=1 Tax=Mucilaginibacter sp. X5P1 TaxID=2723088 RepID=UPI0016103699|nr:hypothetical protein [Mucilaginibacter sp. X5P1]MBB6139987.1 uncharacterized membrane protein YhaH (DUF805 family) [Mucilaginibacter sp. X5P1]
MFYSLIIIAIIFFITHVALLLTAFPKSELARTRYFYSHLTLWITGVTVFILAVQYAGSGQSAFLDYFDTPFKKAMILIFTFALSLTAHLIVKLLVLPLLRKNLR